VRGIFGGALALTLLCGCLPPWVGVDPEMEPERPSVRPVKGVMESERDRDTSAPPKNWALDTPQCQVIVLGRVREVREDPGADQGKPWRITFDVLECFKGVFGSERLTVFVANPWRSLASGEGPLKGRLVLICAQATRSGEWRVHQYRGMRLIRSEHELRSWMRGRMWWAYPEDE